MENRNIIDAIFDIITNNQYDIKAYSKANNRANAVGDALEDYIKDVFAGATNVADLDERDRLLAECFSYQGNTNNPPDIMLKGGDAIEVKKIEKITAGLALNSSYPKAKLFADSHLISKDCRECEEWSERDMIYATGVVDGEKLRNLMFVYGCDFCADKEVYERIYNAVKVGVKTIPDIEFGETAELGRVNRVDPLGITYLRMRGMWHIENPFKVFSRYFELSGSVFNFVAIINEEKYNTFSNVARLEELAERVNTLSIRDINIKNPNNPVQLKRAKLISYAYSVVD